jgi:hypothetical protein
VKSLFLILVSLCRSHALSEISRISAAFPCEKNALIRALWEILTSRSSDVEAGDDSNPLHLHIVVEEASPLSHTNSQ